MTQTQDSGGGFFIENACSSQPEVVERCEKSEEESDCEESSRKRKKHKLKQATRNESELSSSQKNRDDLLSVPIPPDEEKPECDECGRLFTDSFLLTNFDCQVCDACR